MIELLFVIFAALTAPEVSVALEGDAIVIKQGLRTGAIRQAGLERARLALVPLRKDGSEWALWASVDGKTGAVGLLIRLGEKVEVIATVALQTSRPRLASTRRDVWLLDLDGDGAYELIEYPTTHSDVGAQSEGAEVYRYDPSLQRMNKAGRSWNARAPRAFVTSLGIERVLREKLKAKRVERRGLVDVASQSLPSVGSPAPTDTIGFGGSPLPFVGPDLLDLALVNGELMLVHLRAVPQLTIVGTEALGPHHDAPGCAAELVRDRQPEPLRVTWSPDGKQRHQQRLGWDGTRVGAARAPSTVLGPCGAK